jgi:hypothetical protein
MRFREDETGGRRMNLLTSISTFATSIKSIIGAAVEPSVAVGIDGAVFLEQPIA